MTNPVFVILSEAKNLSSPLTPERREILRFAQNDKPEILAAPPVVIK